MVASPRAPLSISELQITDAGEALIGRDAGVVLIGYGDGEALAGRGEALAGRGAAVDVGSRDGEEGSDEEVSTCVVMRDRGRRVDAEHGR